MIPKKTIVQAQGFSLIEALIAITMTSVVVVVVGNSLGSATRLYRTSEMRMRALWFARESMEIVSSITNDQFRCSGGSPICTASDGQQCAALAGYTSCWTARPRDITAGACSGNICSPLHLATYDSGGGVIKWHFLAGAETLVSNIQFTRSIAVENLCRDSSGAQIVCSAPGSISDANRKQITVIVSWDESGHTKNITMSELLTGWNNTP